MSDLNLEQPQMGSVTEHNSEVKAAMGRMSRRSFLWAGIAALGAYSGVHWLASRQEDWGTPWPFRRALEANQGVGMDLYRKGQLSPTYLKADLTELRQNGDVGLEEENFDPSEWTLTVNNVFGKDEPTVLTLEDIKKLPVTTQITEMFCIEGWSMKVEWKGVRFADFAAKYPPSSRTSNPPDVNNKPEELVRYVSMMTPNEAYYVGLDMASALHPQTLLCYEMNGEPLSLDHGAPLRLAIPVKYGVKNLKRIGSITYTDQRPTDYWAEQGYDWYAGL